MTLFKISTFILLSAVISLFISGCKSDELLNNLPQKNVVRGVVLNENGDAISNVSVSLNYGAPVNVNTDGSFTFSDVTVPYTLAIIMNNNRVCIYNDLTIFNPKVYTIGENYYGSYNNQAYLIVKTPAKSINQETLVRFISNTRTENQYNNINDTIISFYIRWSGINNSVNGKLIVLRCTESDNYSSFDNFGFRDTVFQNGGVYLINFSSEGLNYNPPESFVRLFMPQGSGSISAYLTFTDYNLKSNNLGFFHYYYSGNSATIVVPQNLLFDFGIKVLVSSNNPTSSAHYNINMNPGGVCIFPLLQPVNLISPSDDTIGVTNGTYFSHNAAGGVYLTEISSVQLGIRIKIISDKNSVYFPPVQMFGIIPSGEFDWCVIKYNGISNINDFCDGRIATNNEGYNAMLWSEMRHFRFGQNY